MTVQDPQTLVTIKVRARGVQGAWGEGCRVGDDGGRGTLWWHLSKDGGGGVQQAERMASKRCLYEASHSELVVCSIWVCVTPHVADDAAPELACLRAGNCGAASLLPTCVTAPSILTLLFLRRCATRCPCRATGVRNASTSRASGDVLSCFLACMLRV